jgi:hypothetical protein
MAPAYLLPLFWTFYFLKFGGGTYHRTSSHLASTLGFFPSKPNIMLGPRDGFSVTTDVVSL